MDKAKRDYVIATIIHIVLGVFICQTIGFIYSLIYNLGFLVGAIVEMIFEDTL